MVDTHSFETNEVIRSKFRTTARPILARTREHGTFTLELSNEIATQPVTRNRL